MIAAPARQKRTSRRECHPAASPTPFPLTVKTSVAYRARALLTRLKGPKDAIFVTVSLGCAYNRSLHCRRRLHRWNAFASFCPATNIVENTQVGPFLILQKLGRNRRQRVYRARQLEQNKEVALKFIKVPPNVEWHQALDKLDREFNQLQKLKHPNLVKVYGAGVEGKQVFYATELIEGESLAAILGRRGKLAPDQVVEYGRQIANFLEFLHDKSLIHSKLTPDKILITPSHRVKISDLRLNRSKRRRWDATRRRELELAAYMAPEQFTEGATEKSDFYSLGVILYEMLSGELPYPPDTMGRMTRNKMSAPVPSVAKLVMSCPIWLDKLVTQLLDPNPRQRPHSAKAIGLAFEEISRIDATQQAAVSQMASGFTPLTAGQDKSEAKELLGQKTQANQEATPWLHRSWVLAIALLAVVSLMTFLLMRSRPAAILERARVLVLSNDPDSWSDAREMLGPIRTGQGKVAELADQLFFDSLQKTLVARAESGDVSRMDDENYQQFCKALNFQREGREEDAADVYAQLMGNLNPEGDQRHIWREAKIRYEELTERFLWPDDPEGLQAMIDALAFDGDEADLLKAQRMLGKMMIQFAGREDFEPVLQNADEKLREVKQRLVELRTGQSPGGS